MVDRSSIDRKTRKMESFLTWWMFHNAQIIQWLIAIIVLLSVLWIGISFFSKSGASQASSVDHSGLKDQLNSFESNLKNLIEENKKIVVAAPPANQQSSDDINAIETAGGGIEIEALKLEFNTLKTQLQAKQIEVEKLKSSAPAPAAEAKPDETQLARIKVLEAKLAEYEIIEDDIADLSFYKEENKKLKAKLSGLGVEESPDADLDAIETPSIETKIQGEIQATVEVLPEAQAPVVTTAPVPAIAKEHPAAADEGGDLFSEFSADLNEDIVKQFSDSVAPKANDSAAEGDLNLDAMMADIEKLDAFSSDGVNASALEEGPDVDKMAEEADTFDAKKS